VQQLHDFGRQPGFEQHLDQQVRGMRHVFRRFEDHGIPAHQRGKHFPRRNRERKIEGRDQPGDADRPAIAHRPLVAELRRHDATEQPPPFGRRVERGVDPLLHVAAGLGEHLAHFARHRARERVLALDQQLSHPLQNLATNRRGRLGPERKAALRRGDGALQVFGPRTREAPDHVVPIGRIAVLEVLARGGGGPIPSDEVLEFRSGWHGAHGAGQKNGIGCLP